MHKVYHKIEKIAGNVITVQADGVAYRELAQVNSAQGVSLAQVIRLDNGMVDAGPAVGPVKVTAVAPDTIKLDDPNATPPIVATPIGQIQFDNNGNIIGPAATPPATCAISTRVSTAGGERGTLC